MIAASGKSKQGLDELQPASDPPRLGADVATVPVANPWVDPLCGGAMPCPVDPEESSLCELATMLPLEKGESEFETAFAQFATSAVADARTIAQIGPFLIRKFLRGDDGNMMASREWVLTSNPRRIGG
jgi:hypothetical protein